MTFVDLGTGIWVRPQNVREVRANQNDRKEELPSVVIMEDGARNFSSRDAGSLARAIENAEDMDR